VRKVSIEYETKCTVCGKKVSPKVLAIFLATAQSFYMKFHTFLHIRNHTKMLSRIVLFLILTELLNFLDDHVVISDVHGMFAERKTHHIL